MDDDIQIVEFRSTPVNETEEPIRRNVTPDSFEDLTFNEEVLNRISPPSSVIHVLRGQTPDNHTDAAPIDHNPLGRPDNIAARPGWDIESLRRVIPIRRTVDVKMEEIEGQPGRPENGSDEIQIIGTSNGRVQKRWYPPSGKEQAKKQSKMTQNNPSLCSCLTRFNNVPQLGLTQSSLTPTTVINNFNITGNVSIFPSYTGSNVTSGAIMNNPFDAAPNMDFTSGVSQEASISGNGGMNGTSFYPNRSEAVQVNGASGGRYREQWYPPSGNGVSEQDTKPINMAQVNSSQRSCSTLSSRIPQPGLTQSPLPPNFEFNNFNMTGNNITSGAIRNNHFDAAPSMGHTSGASQEASDSGDGEMNGTSSYPNQSEAVQIVGTSDGRVREQWYPPSGNGASEQDTKRIKMAQVNSSQRSSSTLSSRIPQPGLTQSPLPPNFEFNNFNMTGNNITSGAIRNNHFDAAPSMGYTSGASQEASDSGDGEMNGSSSYPNQSEAVQIVGTSDGRVREQWYPPSGNGASEQATTTPRHEIEEMKCFENSPNYVKYGPNTHIRSQCTKSPPKAVANTEKNGSDPVENDTTKNTDHE